MADMALIQGAITGLKTAADIAKSFLELKSIADVQGKVIELQSAILSAQTSALAAQSEQSAMLHRTRELETEIAAVKAWKKTKERYKLINPYAGFFTYALKAESQPTEPAHWICAKCYEDDLAYLLPVLLIARIVLDLVSISRGGTPYQLEFAYFLLFLLAGVAMLVGELEVLWALAAFGIALFSLWQFFVKRDRHGQGDSKTAT